MTPFLSENFNNGLNLLAGFAIGCAATFQLFKSTSNENEILQEDIFGNPNHPDIHCNFR